jgi:hypothetical protein
MEQRTQTDIHAKGFDFSNTFAAADINDPAL